MEKLFYTISEVSVLLDETVVTVRHWSNTFAKYLKVGRNNNNDRRYTKSDINTLREVKHLVRVCGLSLDAAGKKLKGRADGTDNTLRVREILVRLRNSLQEISDSM